MDSRELKAVVAAAMQLILSDPEVAQQLSDASEGGADNRKMKDEIDCVRRLNDGLESRVKELTEQLAEARKKALCFKELADKERDSNKAGREALALLRTLADADPDIREEMKNI